MIEMGTPDFVKKYSETLFSLVLFFTMKRPLLSLTGLALIWGSMFGSAQQLISNKESKEIQMYSLQKDGGLRQIPKEVAAIDSEHFGLGASANASNTVVVARLPGDKAELRYLPSEAIKIVASLPNSIDPRQLRLHRFETKGKMRTSYLGRFHAESSITWNTFSFHAQPLADGSWLLEPNQLGAGEYCFSPKFNNDNYCFGVDN